MPSGQTGTPNDSYAARLRLALISTSPTCGPRRSSVYIAIGMPRKFCRPLSAPPMREPRPPARITPVTLFLSIMRKLSAHQRSAADVAHLDAPAAGAGVRGQGAAQLGIAVGAALPDVAQRRCELVVRSAAA